MFDPIQPHRPAIFLDRDGVLIEEVHYLSSVEQVRLLPGVVEGLRLLERSGFEFLFLLFADATDYFLASPLAPK